MQRALLVTVLTACLFSGCAPKAEAPNEPAAADGRYVGLGSYAPGQLWSKIVGSPPPKDQSVATTADDDEIIIVVDTRTGEIRQCGNLSGHCISNNPWTHPLSDEQHNPVRLTERADPSGKMTPLRAAPQENKP